MARIFADTPDITPHFARFRVEEISLSDKALGQFDFAPQLAAADQLADARVDVIVWGGTSGGWLGIGNDHELCERIRGRTGIAATTSTLAQLAAFEALGIRRYGLVTPYLTDVQQRILANFNEAGYACAGERHLEDRGNFSFSEFGEEVIAGMVREVAADRPDGIAIYCTNFSGTRVAPRLEDELGLPVLDSVALTAWHAMQAAGAQPGRIRGWGRLFGHAAGN